MSTLHTVNKSPFDRPSLTSCLAHVAAGDAILLIEDGVVAARKGCAVEGALRGRARDCAIYVLAPDLAARGMKAQDMIEGVTCVDYGGFVDLAAASARVVAWL